MSKYKDENYHAKYSRDKRIISNVSPEVKACLKKAVDSGLSTSMSKLVSDIIEKNYEIHIANLKIKDAY